MHYNYKLIRYIYYRAIVVKISMMRHSQRLNMLIIFLMSYLIKLYKIFIFASST